VNRIAAAVLVVGLCLVGAASRADAAGGTLTTNTPPLDFGNVRVGTASAIKDFVITNSHQSNSVTVWASVNTTEFPADDGCYAVELQPGESCTMRVQFIPREYGERRSQIDVVSDGFPTKWNPSLDGFGTVGYYLGGTFGETKAFGDAVDRGDATRVDLNQPIIDMVTKQTDGDGYWLLGIDGGVFSYNAPFYGSTGGLVLNAPVIGMAPAPFTREHRGEGYWFVAVDGGVFAYGKAEFKGSMGGKPLNAPVVGMAAHPSGKGYYLVASDGGVFAFGDVPFLGSKGGQPLNSPIVAIATTQTGNGYYLVGADGGVFNYGDALFLGSMGGQKLAADVVDMWVSVRGYWMVAADGGVFNFGAPFFGSMGGQGIDNAITIAGTGMPVNDESMLARAAF
jgi:Abnormal spindle-like microcephaly-assoc'd, ASPM-SPD-2-Hydin